MNLLGIFLLTLVLLSNANAALHNEDPGACTQKRSRQTVVVNDKDGNERVLICLKRNGKHSWRELDNFATLGEYFNPAKDCSDIVQRNKNGRNGFYWIKGSGLKEVKKVWCDVTTDGGGFMLIGYKDSPVSWMLPSNDSLLSPSGPPQWSSGLGDATMMEFRIQIATKNNSKDVKADWVYSFTASRRLSSLLVNGRAGCSFPGIGNINHIKDLRTGDIVTRNFKCSQFGPSYPSNLGWKLMNTCLKTPCAEGYAIFPRSNSTRYDNYGAFSYSTSSVRSGMNRNSTAFVGCEHGKCCACFGPKGRKGDFCAPGCKAINNGTVLDEIQTWFWIRSSPPKNPVWTRCMEYVVRTRGGKIETHFIDGNTGVAKKGSCTKKGIPNIIDGVVNVADQRGLDRVPTIHGLLSFRRDNGKLYISDGKSWKPLVTESLNQELTKRIALEEQKISQIYSEMKNITAKLERKIYEQEKRQNESSMTTTTSPITNSPLTRSSPSRSPGITRPQVTPNKSCKDILLKTPNATSGVYWIKPVQGPSSSAFGVYCDMETHMGGWTLVYSYTFTDYNHFFSKSNAVTPRPNWPARDANVPLSSIPPLSESARGAVDYNLWKEIGEEILIKSNINDWIVCQPQGGNLVTPINGPISCQNIKNVAPRCRGVVPTKIGWHRYGPFLSAKSVFYDFVQTTLQDWPAHDPCGKRRSNEKKGVPNPGGAIFIR